MRELEKSYDASTVEDEMYKEWMESGYFNPDNLPFGNDAPRYSMVLPPPNVTGTLHMGHSFENTVQDVLVRFKRMQGYKTLWLPGTDHAAVATQAKVEGEIYKTEEKTRYDLGREELIRRIEIFASDSHDIIVEQVKKMGASVDWSRESYTADATRDRAVKTAFSRMYEQGLIYQGSRIVNWDPKLQTTISDDEIEWKEEITPFYFLKYGPFTIGTARPETKFGDKYVVMHPSDERYAKWKHGDKVEVEWINGKVTATIVKDEAIDMEFGTGVMTITPWHDATDFEIAQRHGLDYEQIIDEKGKLLDIAGDMAGMHIKKARPLVIEKLQAKGLVENIEENYTHRIATSYRGGGVIEPQIKKQWFVDVNREFTLAYSEIPGIESGDTVTLKRLMRHVVENGQIKILPERFEKIYFHWIDSLRDWCISRQIWFGHRIPVWYDAEGNHRLPKEFKFFLARHAQCESNAQNILPGPESKLTELGKDQAKQLADEMRNKNITKIIASPLTRSQETARIVALELGLPEDTIETWEDVQEIHVGHLIGKKEDPNLHGFAQAQQEGTGESLEKIETRTKATIQKLENLETTGQVLVIGHGGFNAVLKAAIEGKPKEQYVAARTKLGNIPNSSWMELLLIQDPKGGHLEQDEDTFDTWFSSGLWTISTMGWPNDTEDLREFHPTTVIDPGYEILFFWVARMILMTTTLTGQVPFRTVVLHGMVRDKDGQKFSKSRGNGVDPLDMIAKYGTDALRMALVFGSGPGNDVAFDEQRVKGMKHFANKLWNIARFVITNLEIPTSESTSSSLSYSRRGINTNGASNNADASSDSPPTIGGVRGGTSPELTSDVSRLTSLNYNHQPITDADRNILNKLNTTITEVTEHLEHYRLHEAAQSVYQFTWHEFADVYIEKSKEQLNNETTKQNTNAILLYCLNVILTLLHPFMPFITEPIWQLLKDQNLLGQEDLLMVAKWSEV